MTDISDRFWSKVDRLEDSAACWIWTASKNALGYGQFSINSYPVLAHRIAYQLHYGQIPIIENAGSHGTVIMHTCDTPACCNPLHLKAATFLENMRDMYSKNRRKAAKGEKHPCAKLTKSQVLQIRSDPRRSPQIAADYGISQSQVRSIKVGRTWKTV